MVALRLLTEQMAAAGLFMNYRVKPDGTHKIKAPMYADDLALIGTSNSELQQTVNAYHDTCMR